MNNDQRILELVSRKLAGEASREELRELHELLSSDPAAAERQEILGQYWTQQDTGSHPSVEDNLQKVLSTLGLPAAEKKSALRRLSPWIKGVAAILVLLAGLAIIQFRHDVRSVAGTAILLEKRNAKGTRSIIQLTDGSKIWLNADSRIKYPEAFKGATRDIYLNGEAFFDVAKNPAHPFIIHLANGTVRVLGTSFNIRAYDNEAVVETSVTTGRVAFIPRYRSAGKKQDTIYVMPDHKARYTYTREELSAAPTVAQEDKAWTEGKLIFNALTLEEIGMQLERAFGKKVAFADDAPRHFVFTGSFGNNSLEEIMYYLSRTKHFNYEITNSELLIK